MLHYTDRQSRIHIITLDQVLATDVYERLHNYPGLESVELIRPGDGKSAITVQDIKQLARETTTSKVLIIDVRRQTRARLQRPYSDIVRFNRADFNRHCYSVLLGDGPVSLLTPNKGKEGLYVFLSNLRVDFSPAVFFSSPLFYHSYEEIAEMARDMAVRQEGLLLDKIPQHLQKYFKDRNLTPSQLGRYLRADDVPDSHKERKKRERHNKLRRLYFQIVKDELPEDQARFTKAISKEGCALPGEALKINVYPFFFEEWVLDLVRKSERTAVYR